VDTGRSLIQRLCLSIQPLLVDVVELPPAPERSRGAAHPPGTHDEACTELELAIGLCGNERERAVLERKLADAG
jgi:hypothetical protein